MARPGGDSATMKSFLFLLTVTLFATATGRAAELIEVASFPNQQVTGVGVSQKSGRVFVNFPDWSDDHTISVAEIVDGQPRPFPNEEWNQRGDAATHFVCVQSVVVDDREQLWILDPAAPKMKQIVKGGPKLAKVDLATNKVVQTIPFGEDVAPQKSYLNDVRIDNTNNVAYMTDSGKGAIVVVDLQTGKARRLLDGAKSTAAEKEVKLKVDGRDLYDADKKSAPQIQSDGIAFDASNGYLYYHALTGHTLYRIKTDYLRDAKISAHDLATHVENMGPTPAPDGMLEAPKGEIILTAIEQNGLVRFDPGTKKTETIIEDKRLSWPDTLSWGPNGSLYVTASQIQNMPRFNNGRSARTEPYRLFKLSGLAEK